MKILILHANNNITQSARRAVTNISFNLVKYARGHDYILHHYNDPVCEKLRNEKFNAVILDVTFLYLRNRNLYNKNYNKDFVSEITEKYNFLVNPDTVKLAFPQDDYHRPAILEELVKKWKIDGVFTPLYDHREILYPSIQGKTTFYKALTGYVDEKDIAIAEKYSQPFEQRSIDVGFRSKNLPARYGRHGKIKSDLSNNFITALKKINQSEDLNLDVSNDLNKTLLGEKWFEFLGNSKFTLGCESGCSVNDPYGLIWKKSEEYEKANPEASFEEIEAACFPGEDRYKFSSISPRLFEAAMTKSCQILIEGEYLELVPGEDYIELKPDFSNISDVFEQMQDSVLVKNMIDSCYEKLIASQKYSYRTFAGQQLEIINSHLKNFEKISQNPSDNLYSEDIEPFIEAAIKLSRETGYVCIPAELNQQSFVNILNTTSGILADKLELLENKIHLRSGKLGAVREFFDLNKFLDYEDSNF